MRPFLRPLLLSLFAILLLALPAQAQQFADNVGPLKVELKDDGEWKAESRSGWLLFSNRTAPRAIKLYFSKRVALSSGSRTVRANVLVRGKGDTQSFAGLLFGHKDARNFMAFLIRNDGAVVWMNQAQGRTNFREAAGVRARMDGTDILELRETPGKIQLLLNGKVALTAENPGGFAPSFGIVTVGTGRFGFDAFAIDEAGVKTAPKKTVPEKTEPRVDKTPATPQQARRRQILLATTLGILFHELGHAVIGETKLPATGPEEDVADGFSAFIMSLLVTGADDPETGAALEGITRYSTLLWYYIAKNQEEAGIKHPWQDEHAPNMKRFRNTFCIVYGSNPQRYADLALRFEVTQQTRARCLEEYKKRFAAWETLMRTVTRKSPDDPQAMHPADAPGGKIILKFGEPKTALGKELVALLNGPQAMLPQIMAYLEKGIVWPNDLTVEFKECDGIQNAAYISAKHAIVFCYDLTVATTNLILAREKKDGPSPDKVKAAADPVLFLQGKWVAEIRNALGLVAKLTFTFSPDGTYVWDIVGGENKARRYGNWKAVSAGGDQFTVDLVETKVEPPQACDKNGNCKSNSLQPMRSAAKVKGRDAFYMDGFNFKRAR